MQQEKVAMLNTYLQIIHISLLPYFSERLSDTKEGMVFTRLEMFPYSHVNRQNSLLVTERVHL